MKLFVIWFLVFKPSLLTSGHWVCSSIGIINDSFFFLFFPAMIFSYRVVLSCYVMLFLLVSLCASLSYVAPVQVLAAAVVVVVLGVVCAKRSG
mmetsp:Transcript_2095/g.3312  ORF Transcript_2095/g.3312 Transcript_2095/m.3312 type:complete len:93 (-) Transcript_2095:386-664(-)